MTQKGWDVVQRGRVVNRVFFDSDMTADDVKRSLIDHDGFPEDIRVVSESELPRGASGRGRRYSPNEDLKWREVYSREYHAAAERGVDPLQSREEASRAAWADYEHRTGQPALTRNGPATRLDQTLDRVVRGQREVTFDTEGYTREQVDRLIATAKERGLHAAYDGRFVLVRDLKGLAARTGLRRNSDGRHKLHFAGYDFTSGPSGTVIRREYLQPRAGGDYGADPLGDGTFRMVPSGDIVDFEERNQRLKRFSRNPPLWDSDDEAEYMRLLDRYDAEMAESMSLEDSGRVAQAAVHRRSAEAAMRAADHISKRYAANGSGYYVWALAVRSNDPLAEGPWGPYETLESAKTFARIGATEGAHDRAVSVGFDPEAASFRIVRRYQAGSGDRLL